MTWQATAAVAAAHERDPDLAREVEAAEEAKIVACEPVNAALQERIRGEEEDGDFGDEVYAELSDFVVRVFPIGDVEDCAEAHEEYRASIQALQHRLAELDVTE